MLNATQSRVLELATGKINKLIPDAMLDMLDRLGFRTSFRMAGTSSDERRQQTERTGSHSARLESNPHLRFWHKKTSKPTHPPTKQTRSCRTRLKIADMLPDALRCSGSRNRLLSVAIRRPVLTGRSEHTRTAR
ncbi:hypothetical protein ACIPO9_04305 [Pseudomonas sp. NPDC090203]|uniref:hypothetical protein n=1 Tax=Pseudomonas sp. NPDC090203 TaxID=3364477 RepID=UPI0037F23F8F